MAEIRSDRVRKTADRERLEPDLAWAGQPGQEETLIAEQNVCDSGHRLDVEVHALFEHADVPWMHEQALAGGKIVGDDLAVELDPCLRRTADLLKHEAAAAKNSGAERTLKTHRELHTRRAAQKSMTMDHVPLARGNVDRHDLAGKLGGERDHAWRALCRVLGHEETAAAGRAHDRA